MLLLLMKRQRKLKDIIVLIVKCIILYYSIYMIFGTARSMGVSTQRIFLGTLLILIFFPKSSLVMNTEINNKRYQFAYYQNLNANFIIWFLISHLYRYVLYAMVSILAYAAVVSDIHKILFIQQCALLILITLSILTVELTRELHKIQVVNKPKASGFPIVSIVFAFIGYMIGASPSLSENGFALPDHTAFTWMDTVRNQYIYFIYACLIAFIILLIFRMKRTAKNLSIDIGFSKSMIYKKSNRFFVNKIQGVDNIYKFSLLKLLRDIPNFKIIVENHLYLLFAMGGILLYSLTNHITNFGIIITRFNLFTYVYMFSIITIYRNFLDIQYFDKNIVYFIKTKYKIQKIVKSTIHIASIISITFYTVLFILYFLVLQIFSIKLILFYFFQIMGLYVALYVCGLLTFQNPIFNRVEKKANILKRIVVPAFVFEIIRSVRDVDNITFMTILWKVIIFVVVIAMSSFISKEMGNPHGEYEEVI